MSTRPRPYSPKRVQTFYMDYVSGRGFTDAGTRFQARISRGYKNPSLEDKLEAVYAVMDRAASEATLVFTGQVPKVNALDVDPRDDEDTIRSRHWLLAKTGAWKSLGHWIGFPPTGRFEHEVTRKYIEVRTAAEWFGSTPLTPPQAREAFLLLEQILAFAFKSYAKGQSNLLLKTPAATGANLWAAALPQQIILEPLTDDIAEELHATSGQHHIEHTVAGPNRDTRAHEDVVPLIDPSQSPKIDGLAKIDGRFMYAALCAELGTGPGVRLKADQASDLLHEEPYARARYRVKFRVPRDWSHVGVFGMRHHDPRDGWYYPNRAGATGETWADGAEVFVARKFGWDVMPLEAVRFNQKMPAEHKKTNTATGLAYRPETTARPLDAWATKLTEARYAVTNDPRMDPIYKMAIGGALRAILIQTIGKFASRGRKKTIVAYDRRDVDAYAQSLRPTTFGKAQVYTVPSPLTEQQRAFYHPEFAAQVWGRARAKVLFNKVNGHEAGVLTLPAGSVLGVVGDAVYTSHLPSWAQSVDQGGDDDGKVGRLRIQGYLQGPLRTPALRKERDAMAERAVKAGTDIDPELFTDRAAFDFEFDHQDDDVRHVEAAE